MTELVDLVRRIAQTAAPAGECEFYAADLELGRLFDELARQEPTCAADVRRAAQAELQIAERVERLIGP